MANDRNFISAEKHTSLVMTLRQLSHIVAPKLLLVLIAAGISGSFLNSDAGCIPEPGLAFYGSVTGSFQFSVSSNTVLWKVSSTSSGASVSSTLINVNGQNFYLATIPFETRFLGGISLGAPTLNTLPFSPTPTTYARQAMVNGTNAAIVYTSSGSTNTFIFGPGDRGRIERVDLALSPSATFVQWLSQHGLPTGADPNSDPTHKGMTLMQEYIAGLNPNDPDSSFKFVGIQPTFQGLQLQWLSTPGTVYALEQGLSASGPYSVIQSNLVATPGTNTFTIPLPANGSSLFVRVHVQQGN